MEPWSVRFRSSAVARAAGVLLLACLSWVHQGGGTAVVEAEEDAKTCRIEVEQQLAPEVILLGETVNVRLILRPFCGRGPDQPLHVILAIDTSASMQGQAIVQAKAAARQFVDELDLPGNPGSQVGIVSFNNRAETICPLTNQSAKLIGCLNRLGNAPTGGTDIAAGLQLSRNLLQKAKKQEQESPFSAVLLLSDGANQAGCAPVQSAAGDLKRDGSLLGTVCVGSFCDEECLRSAASQPRFALAVPDPAQLSGAFGRLRREMVDQVLEDATITQLLPPELTLAGVGAPGEPDPFLDEDPEGGSSLRWKLPLLPEEGLTLSFRLRPRRLGEQASGRKAWAVLRRSSGGGLSADFPQRPIVVLQAPVLPTAQTGSTTEPSATEVPPQTPEAPPALSSATPPAAPPSRRPPIVHVYLPYAQLPRSDVGPDPGVVQPIPFPVRIRP